jgi:hypothetical protein
MSEFVPFNRRLAGVGVLLMAIGLVFAPSPSFAQSCTQTLSSGANVGSAVSSAAAGSVICLNNGSYGGFTLSGVTKAPRVTVRAVSSRGATFTSKLTFSNSTSGITIQGVNMNSVEITGANTREISLIDFNSTREIIVQGISHASPNILLDNFSQLNFTLSNADPAGVAFYGSRSTPIATVRNATIDGGCADGIRVATPVIVENSRIMNKQVGNCPNDPHTDALQFYGGPVAGTIIRGNYWYRNVQVLAAYDSVEGVLIENNVFDPGPDGERRPCQIELYSDANSIVRHNTVLYRGSSYGSICIDRKSADNAGFGTVIVDNIANSITVNNGSTVAERRNHLVRSGAAAGDITGSPTYVGGATPTTFAGFELAANSAGKDDGLSPAGSDIGVNVSGVPQVPSPAAPTNVRITP